MTHDGLTMAVQYFQRDMQHSALQRWFARTRWQNKFLSDFALYVTEGKSWSVFLPIPCGGWHGLAVHLAPLGSTDDPPAIATLRGQVYRTKSCHSWEQARTEIERYLGRFGTLQERIP